MTASEAFRGLPSDFWAYVRLVSQAVGYSIRGTSALRRFDETTVRECVEKHSLSPAALGNRLRNGQTYLTALIGYLNRRAEMLERHVQPMLMSRGDAAAVFKGLRRQLKPTCPLPMNKQKGKKRHEAYLTGIVNMLTEATLGDLAFQCDPRAPITVSRQGQLLCALARRMDGAFPSSSNPSAVWEVKEYYDTTTFGSRIADAVYETMLDGFELLRLRTDAGVRVLHYLIVDDHYTWWRCGKSYLCRIVDMLHEELLDEAVFGREVLTRWPQIVRTWLP